MTCFYVLFLVFLIVIVLEPSQQQTNGDFTLKLSPNEMHMSYDEASQLLFSFKPNCEADEPSLTVWQIDESGKKIKWTYEKRAANNLNYNSTAQQYFIENANYLAHSGNYSATCTPPPPSSIISYQSVPNFTIKVKPQILSVSDSVSPPSAIVTPLPSSYKMTIRFDDKTTSKQLHFHVGSGYYGNGEVGNFTYDLNLMSQLTTSGDGQPKTTANVQYISDLPNGTMYSFNVEIDALATKQPNKCQFDIKTSTFMSSNPGNTTHEVTLTLDVEYQPQKVTVRLSNFDNGTCSVSCLATSSCPSTLKTELSLVEIYDANRGMTYVLTGQGRPLAPALCDDININDRNMTFTCHVENSVGKTSVKKAFNQLESQIEVVGTYKPSSKNCDNGRSNNQLLWWDILLIIVAGVFFVVIIIGTIVCLCKSSGGDKKRDSNNQLPPLMSPTELQRQRPFESSIPPVSPISNDGSSQNQDLELFDNAAYGRTAGPSQPRAVRRTEILV